MNLSLMIRLPTRSRCAEPDTRSVEVLVILNGCSRRMAKKKGNVIVSRARPEVRCDSERKSQQIHKSTGKSIRWTTHSDLPSNGDAYHRSAELDSVAAITRLVQPELNRVGEKDPINWIAKQN